MIDLHCHILPALDDGSLDLSDSVAMARVAERDGIEVVCATPHIRFDHDVRIGELARRVGQLQQELDERGVGVRVAQGGEVSQLAADDLSDGELREVSLGGNGWILLEPAPGPLAGELAPQVRRLAARGFQILLAHPERHAGADLEERLVELVDAGCLLQWTADFVARADPADPDALVLRLARDGLVHVLASDAHSSHGGRAVRLSDGLARLREVCSAEQARWIERAPEAILRGGTVSPPW